MKKIFNYLLVIVLVFTFCINLVKADNLTFDEIVQKVKESNTYKSLVGSGIQVEISNDNNTLTISYPGGDERSTIFSYSDDVISYSFNAPKNDTYTMSRTKLDAQWIITLLQIVSEPKGYSLLHLQTLTLNKLKKYTLDENGIEVTTFRYNYLNPENNENIEVSAYDTFKININKLDLNIVIDENTNNNINNKEEEITEVLPKENPRDISISKIAELLPTKLKEVYTEQFGELVAEDTSNFTVEYDYNSITVYQEIDSRKELLRKVNVEDDIISHSYIYDTELGIDGERIVNIFIYKSIFMTVGELYGYSDAELKFLYTSFFEAEYDSNGYEFTSTKEQSDFKLDINSFNLEREIDVEQPIIDNDSTNNISNSSEENSNNSTVFVIMIVIVIISLGLLFYINRDMFGTMLRNKYRR